MNKKTLIKLEVSIGTILALLIISFVIAFFMQKSTNNAMGKEIQILLDSYEEDTYIVTEKLSIPSPISTIGYFYLVERKNVEEPCYAALIRIMGISGPATAVFLHENNFTTFIDFAGFNNARSYKSFGINESQISYWKDAIDTVIEDNFTQVEDNNE